MFVTGNESVAANPFAHAVVRRHLDLVRHICVHLVDIDGGQGRVQLNLSIKSCLVTVNINLVIERINNYRNYRTFKLNIKLTYNKSYNNDGFKNDT